MTKLRKDQKPNLYHFRGKTAMKIRRQKKAIKRISRPILFAFQQVFFLDSRLGSGIGAVKERAKLAQKAIV